MGYYGQLEHNQPTSHHESEGGYHPHIQQQMEEAVVAAVNYVYYILHGRLLVAPGKGRTVSSSSVSVFIRGYHYVYLCVFASFLFNFYRCISWILVSSLETMCLLLSDLLHFRPIEPGCHSCSNFLRLAEPLEHVCLHLSNSARHHHRDWYRSLTTAKTVRDISVCIKGP